MKLTKQNRGTALVVISLAAVVGSLGWDIVERLLRSGGNELNLTVGPIGFDLHMLAVSMQANPGTVMGLLGGWLLFKAL
jgi:hypothetical protein